ncbi:DUF2784 domain-containing protein [Pedobacter sp. KBW06]|uniref:DUF2784 domain-containing protein n=1 Tax=Pedobacter sp. KBW06 TaxID=2153359 RepID=UPI000F5B2304|nr:DUF2784 domain-containing protein [Pedobacter sp. KBW06]RQO66282.1 DUF2784 domain-containing protein [Pedobacter sp. KBW06]
MSLNVLDFIYTLVHLLIIGFNLFAWAFPATRRLHLYGVAVTLACWLILGIWYGIGYCPVTDWQWQVKAQLGEQNLPNSFVKYYADKIIGQSVDANLIDALTAGSFLLSIIISVYLNFFSKKSKLKAKSN